MWNIALDQNSGPKIGQSSTSSNPNKGLVTIRSDSMDSIKYEIGYFSLGHFSKFVEPNSRRIQSNSYDNQLESVAFVNPDKSIIVVVSNRESGEKKVKIQWQLKSFEVSLSGLSASTFRFSS